MRSLADEARAARHMAVLDEATVEFNRSGVAGASLTAIARRVGLGRAALYNYCIDRQDLVYQCYSRTNASLRKDLDRAAQANANGLGKVVTFLRLALDSSNNQPRAVLTELAFLTKAQQAVVQKLRSGNVETLAMLIREGIKDASIRNCNVEVVCQAIFGILSWATLSLLWISFPDEDFASRMANAIPDLVTDGMASEGMEVLPSRKRIKDVIRNPRGSDWDDRRESLALVASRLFNSRGIDGVSLDDVALELGATKGAVYHYFQSKPALVAYCYERAFNIYEQIMSAAEKGLTGLECTVIAIELNVEAQLESISPLWMSTGAEMLPKPLQRAIVRRAGALWARSVKLAERGVKDGSLRRLDFEPVKQASAGSFNYLISSKDNGKHSVSEVAAEISRLLLLGLRPHKAHLNGKQAFYETL
ncbi:transcriptional regulator, TetR family [Burkholderia sp. GAS332]|nr:transcriptional regulator, TetR family [Burkholderia sp. GAS332]